MTNPKHSTPTPQDAGMRVHGTSISLNGAAALLTGPSGTGKSALALQVMALGATLIADDQTECFLQDDHVWVRAPENLPHLIEARGVGLLPATLVPSAPLVLVVDMGQLEHDRLPTPKTTTILNKNINTFHKIDGAHFPSAIFHYLRASVKP